MPTYDVIKVGNSKVVDISGVLISGVLTMKHIELRWDSVVPKLPDIQIRLENVNLHDDSKIEILYKYGATLINVKYKQATITDLEITSKNDIDNIMNHLCSTVHGSTTFDILKTITRPAGIYHILLGLQKLRKSVVFNKDRVQPIFNYLNIYSCNIKKMRSTPILDIKLDYKLDYHTYSGQNFFITTGDQKIQEVLNIIQYINMSTYTSKDMDSILSYIRQIEPVTRMKILTFSHYFRFIVTNMPEINKLYNKNVLTLFAATNAVIKTRNKFVEDTSGTGLTIVDHPDHKQYFDLNKNAIVTYLKTEKDQDNKAKVFNAFIRDLKHPCPKHPREINDLEMATFIGRNINDKVYEEIKNLDLSNIYLPGYNTYPITIQSTKSSVEQLIKNDRYAKLSLDQKQKYEYIYIIKCYSLFKTTNIINNWEQINPSTFIYLELLLNTLNFKVYWQMMIQGQLRITNLINVDNLKKNKAIANLDSIFKEIVFANHTGRVRSNGDSIQSKLYMKLAKTFSSGNIISYFSAEITAEMMYFMIYEIQNHNLEILLSETTTWDRLVSAVNKANKYKQNHWLNDLISYKVHAFVDDIPDNIDDLSDNYNIQIIKKIIGITDRSKLRFFLKSGIFDIARLDDREIACKIWLGNFNNTVLTNDYFVKFITQSGQVANYKMPEKKIHINLLKKMPRQYDSQIKSFSFLLRIYQQKDVKDAIKRLIKLPPHKIVRIGWDASEYKTNKMSHNKINYIQTSLGYDFISNLYNSRNDSKCLLRFISNRTLNKKYISKFKRKLEFLSDILDIIYPELERLAITNEILDGKMQRRFYDFTTADISNLDNHSYINVMKSWKKLQRITLKNDMNNIFDITQNNILLNSIKATLKEVTLSAIFDTREINEKLEFTDIITDNNNVNSIIVGNKDLDYLVSGVQVVTHVKEWALNGYYLHINPNLVGKVISITVSKKRNEVWELVTEKKDVTVGLSESVSFPFNTWDWNDHLRFQSEYIQAPNNDVHICNSYRVGGHGNPTINQSEILQVFDAYSKVASSPNPKYQYEIQSYRRPTVTEIEQNPEIKLITKVIDQVFKDDQNKQKIKKIMDDIIKGYIVADSQLRCQYEYYKNGEMNEAKNVIVNELREKIKVLSHNKDDGLDKSIVQDKLDDLMALSDLYAVEFPKGSDLLGLNNDSIIEIHEEFSERLKYFSGLGANSIIAGGLKNISLFNIFKIIVQLYTLPHYYRYFYKARYNNKTIGKIRIYDTSVYTIDNITNTDISAYRCDLSDYDITNIEPHFRSDLCYLNNFFHVRKKYGDRTQLDEIVYDPSDLIDIYTNSGMPNYRKYNTVIPKRILLNEKIFYEELFSTSSDTNDLLTSFYEAHKLESRGNEIKELYQDKKELTSYQKSAIHNSIPVLVEWLYFAKKKDSGQEKTDYQTQTGLNTEENLIASMPGSKTKKIDFIKHLKNYLHVKESGNKHMEVILKNFSYNKGRFTLSPTNKIYETLTSYFHFYIGTLQNTFLEMMDKYNI